LTRSLRISFGELGLIEKDFLTALGLWIVLEVLCFWLAPHYNLIQPGDRLPLWFLTSLPLGIGGAILIGASSQFMASSHQQDAKTTKIFLNSIGQLAGGIGLAGVLFPLMMVALEFVVKTFNQLLQAQ
jgi:cytochrome c oxidase assembly factor CtaG